MTPAVMGAAAGVPLALAVGAAASVTRLDRHRGWYPFVLVVIAAFYGLFAAIDGRAAVLASELAFMLPFLVLAWLGLRRSLWLVVAALAGHGVFDLVHPHLVSNAGVPPWWPVFCSAYDLAAALYLAWRLQQERVPA